MTKCAKKLNQLEFGFFFGWRFGGGRKLNNLPSYTLKQNFGFILKHLSSEFTNEDLTVWCQFGYFFSISLQNLHAFNFGGSSSASKFGSGSNNNNNVDSSFGRWYQRSLASSSTVNNGLAGLLSPSSFGSSDSRINPLAEDKTSSLVSSIPPPSSSFVSSTLPLIQRRDREKQTKKQRERENDGNKARNTKREWFKEGGRSKIESVVFETIIYSYFIRKTFIELVKKEKNKRHSDMKQNITF